MMLRRVAVSFVVCWGSVFSAAAAFAEPDPGLHPSHHGSHKPSTSLTDAQKAEHAKELAARKAHFEAERARHEHRELADKAGEGTLTPHQREELREAHLKHQLAHAEEKDGATLSPHELAELHEKWAKHRREVDERRAAMERLLGLMNGKKPPGSSPTQTASSPTQTVSGVSGLSGSGSSGSGSNGSGSDSSPSDNSGSNGSTSDTSNGVAQSGPTLSKEQEAELRHEYHWLLEHFDANGDGRLDRAEIERAREAFHRHTEEGRENDARRHTEDKESEAKWHSHEGHHASGHAPTAPTTTTASTTK